MRRFPFVLCLLAAAAGAYGQRRPFGRGAETAPPPLGANEAEKKILAVLDQMRETNATYLSVPPSDGRLLRVMTEAVNASHVVEVGTSTGYSGLWLLLALQRTGGKLTTFEYDAGRAATARKHFDQAGMGASVTIVEGDAHQNVIKLKGPIDVVFIDADKEGYVDYLEKLLPLVRPGGVIFAHNVNPGMSGDGYVRRVTTDPRLETIFYMDGGGMSVTLKKR